MRIEEEAKSGNGKGSGATECARRREQRIFQKGERGWNGSMEGDDGKIGEEGCRVLLDLRWGLVTRPLRHFGLIRPVVPAISPT